MPISSADQKRIQARIESASREERERLKKDAEEFLSSRRIPAVQARGVAPQERQYIEQMAEYLVRIECLELGQGWWYRQKRRLEILRAVL